MEDSYGNEEINLLRWSNGRQHRSPTIDTYFYPHEVRKLVRRQKIIEVIISLALIVAYLFIMGGSGVSFYFFYEAQNHTNSNLWIFDGSCMINNSDSNWQCLLVYGFQVVVGLGAAILILCSLVKSCCCRWYSKVALCVNFIFLMVLLLFAIAVSIFLNASLVISKNTTCVPEIGSFCIAFIISWGVVAAVCVTILLEVILAILVKKCRRRMTYHRLE